MTNKKLIIIPFGFPFDWPCDYEKQTASNLAKRNIVIAWLTREGIGLKKIILNFIRTGKSGLITKNKKLISVKPIKFIPFLKNNFIEKLNYYSYIIQLRLVLFFFTDNYQKLLWIFSSQKEFPCRLFNNKFQLIYDCVDYPYSIDKKVQKRDKIQEENILKKAKIVFANSRILFKLKKRQHKKVFLVPQGFNTNLFSGKKKLLIPKDIISIPVPRIGYIGNINFRLDFSLIWKTALLCPNFSFIFIGPYAPETIQDKIAKTENWLKKLNGLKNVYFLGDKNKKKVPAYINYLNICIIPYNTRYSFNKYCFPMKLLEYFYFEKPVVSTPIEELKYYKKYVKLCSTPALFKKSLELIYSENFLSNCKKDGPEIAISNSWKNKINLMLNTINHYVL